MTYSVFYYDLPILGKTAVAEDGTGICAVFLAKEQKIPRIFKDNPFETSETPLIKQTAAQLDRFLNGRRRGFDLPLSLSGTKFQQKIYTELLNIRYGQTVSYRQLAERAGNPRACRAAGAACGQNPLLILTPCHRCIASDGTLKGFAAGLQLKKRLLDLEKPRG